MYPYRTVEQVITKIYGYPDDFLRNDATAVLPEKAIFKNSAIIGRVKNFQRLGIGPEKTGRGNRKNYSFEDICQILFCLELTEFGVDPKSLKGVIEYTWRWIGSYLKSEPYGDGNYVYVFEPSFMSLWAYDFGSDTLAYGGADLGHVLDFSRQLPALPLDKHDRRLAMINLSSLRVCLIEALDEVGKGDTTSWRKSG